MVGLTSGACRCAKASGGRRRAEEKRKKAEGVDIAAAKEGGEPERNGEGVLELHWIAERMMSEVKRTVGVRCSRQCSVFGSGR